MRHNGDEVTTQRSDSTRTTWLLPLGLCAGYFLVLLDVTVVNVALPRLDTDLHAGAGLAWVVDAYTVPLAALLLAAGAVGDRIGHRRMVLTGFAGFGVASIVCALSPTSGVLIAGRALQGTAAALMLPGTLAMLSQAAPSEKARASAIGRWAAVGGAALPAGPVFGGLLVQAAGWRAVFWLGVPVIIAVLAAVLTSTTGSPRPARHPSERSSSPPNRILGRTVDWPGAILLTVLLGCAVTAIIQGPSNTALGGAMVATAACAGSALWLVERRAPQPLLRVPTVARQPLVRACGVAAVMNLCAQGALFVLTQVFQAVHGLSPLVAGMVMLPAMVPLPLLGTTSGRRTNKVGPWRTSALGLLIAVVGFGGLALSLRAGNGPVDYPILLCSLAVWGCGIGVLTPGIVTAAMRAVPDSPGTASGASNTSRQAGGAIGVALFGAIAGTPTGAGFADHVSALMWGGAAAFLLAAVPCVLPIRSPGHDQG
ncbi:MFS transporter [Kutzneria sp. CA-103260]|uniref:MFS transporter n=1 Tax=Kutzneria sp. CA-103260 TaxID=2802641 RepID=UPI001BAB6C1B|nr:MFS transporter [Kutzneria sp. CA-103260]QUQ63020.1 MFS transporter methylenomycin A resistance protein [Kutzneria sp. CA-103260]